MMDDSTDFENELTKLVHRHYVGENPGELPMGELRDRLEQSGILLGRLLAITAWEARPVDGELMMYMRGKEEQIRERALNHLEHYKPGGMLR